VPYRIDAAVKAVQLSTLNSVSDRPRPETRAFKLPPSGDPMLSFRDPRHLKIWGVAFLTHVGT